MEVQFVLLAELDEKLSSKELNDEQREKLENSIKILLEELANNESSKMWFENKNMLDLWNNAIDKSGKDSAAEGIKEIAPIDLRYLDEELSIEIPTLCSGYDSVFGPHDASAFHSKRRRETGQHRPR